MEEANLKTLTVDEDRSMIWRKLFIVGSVIIPAACVLWFQQQQAKGLQTANAQLRSQIESLQQQAAMVRGEARAIEGMVAPGLRH
jgi:cell division protein FtsB